MTYYDIRPDCYHYFDVSVTSNAMFDELGESPLMSPLARIKHRYVRLAIAIFSHLSLCFVKSTWFAYVYDCAGRTVERSSLSLR